MSAEGARAKRASQEGKTWLRHTQHYLLGSLDEEAHELFLLAIAKATELGARTPAAALKAICDLYVAVASDASPEPQQITKEESVDTYIGTKVVSAKPMDECAFLRDYKRQDVAGRETRAGYLVVYEDGYQSWSPRETFERAYRRVL